MENAQVQLRFIENSRGGRMLVHDNYTFHVKLRKEDRCYWTCTNRDCRASINTHNDVITKVSANHNHPSDEGKICARAFVSKMKKRCRDSTMTVPSMYEEELAKLRTPEWDDVTRENAEKIPTYQSCKSSLYRNRMKTKPPVPMNREDIRLEGKWRETTSGERFLLHDDEGADRQIIFATDDNLEELSAAEAWFCGGTFYSRPKHFKQLYTIHAFISGEMFPLVYGLLPDKREATYCQFFSNILRAATDRRIQLHPVRIMIDFEVAARNAISRVFPMADVKGCFFHFTQCVWRKVQSLGLQGSYRNDENFKKLVRRAAALPLVPVDRVEDVWFEALEDREDGREEVTAFADYITDTWIEGDKRIWNHHCTEGPRTINHLDGWHRKINNLLTHAHPNIYVVIEMIKKLQAANEVKMAQYAAGGLRPAKKRKYRDLETRLRQLKLRFAQGELDVMQYTDAVSYLIHLG